MRGLGIVVALVAVLLVPVVAGPHAERTADPAATRETDDCRERAVPLTETVERTVEETGVPGTEVTEQVTRRVDEPDLPSVETTCGPGPLDDAV